MYKVTYQRARNVGPVVFVKYFREFQEGLLKFKKIFKTD